MPEEQDTKEHGWWRTLPGILTAIAAILTATGGLIVALHQTGFFDKPDAAAQRAAGGAAESPASSAVQGNSDSQLNPSPGAGGTATPAGAARHRRVNLLASDIGGQIIVASSEYWKATIDGSEVGSFIAGPKLQVVYAFKDEQPATFDTFTMLISETNNQNIQEFELFAGNESPTGSFDSLGKFQTQNIKLFKMPYQEFKFRPVTAKYLKLVPITNYYGNQDGPYLIHEFQLYGYLK